MTDLILIYLFTCQSNTTLKALFSKKRLEDKEREVNINNINNKETTFKNSLKLKKAKGYHF